MLPQHRAENLQAIVAAEQGVIGPLWMRHQPDDIASLVADASDVVERTIGIRLVGLYPMSVGVAENDLIASLELLERFWIDKVAPLPMGRTVPGSIA